MCKYTLFHFLCGGTKIKIAEPCDQASTNYLGIPFCKEDPYPHIEDAKPRQYTGATYGPGICSNIHCRENWGMVPKDEANKHLKRDLVEDDTPFDMSPSACQQREDVWARACLDEDQQMEAYWQKEWPLPIESMTLNAKTWLSSEMVPIIDWCELWNQVQAQNPSPDDVDWRELNPKYLSQRALQHVTAVYLPALVTDTRTHEHHTTTPLKPQFGPFRVKSHTCRPAGGCCKICGIYHSKKSAKNLSIAYDADTDWRTRLEASGVIDLGGSILNSIKSSDDLPHCKPLRPDLPVNPYGIREYDLERPGEFMQIEDKTSEEERRACWR